MNTDSSCVLLLLRRLLSGTVTFRCKPSLYLLSCGNIHRQCVLLGGQWCVLLFEDFQESSNKALNTASTGKKQMTVTVEQDSLKPQAQSVKSSYFQIMETKVWKG